jgi:hypothetical protein
MSPWGSLQQITRLPSAGGSTPSGRPRPSRFRHYQLAWTTVVGNRVGGHGWNKASRPLAEAPADPAGRIDFDFAVPNDLGGAHALSRRGPAPLPASPSK